MSSTQWRQFANEVRRTLMKAEIIEKTRDESIGKLFKPVTETIKPISEIFKKVNFLKLIKGIENKDLKNFQV